MAAKPHRLNLMMPRDSLASMDRLKELSGHNSYAGIIRAALRLYHVCIHAQDKGKTVQLRDKDGNVETLIAL